MVITGQISAYVTSALEVLRRLPHDLDNVRQHADNAPHPDSQVAKERTRCAHLELLDTAYSGAQHLVFLASMDHLAGLGRSLTDPSLSCTPYTCARAVLEACANAIWLLDPRIADKERIARSLSLRLENQRMQEKFRQKVALQGKERHLTWLRQNAADSVPKRIDELKERARRMGIRERRSKNGKLLSFGSGLPKLTERIRDVFDVEPEYALLSSVAHGNQSGLLNLTGSIRHSERGLELHADLQPQLAVWLIGNALDWHSRGALAYLELFGRSRPEAENAVDRAYGELRMRTPQDRRQSKHHRLWIDD